MRLNIELVLACPGPTDDATLEDDLPDIPTPYDTIAPPQPAGPYLALGPVKETYAGLKPQAEGAYIEPGTPVEFVATGTYAAVPVRHRPHVTHVSYNLKPPVLLHGMLWYGMIEA